MPCLISVSISPMMGSIYNTGVWDETATACVNVANQSTLDSDATARQCYKETGRSLDNQGCLGEAHILVHGCVIFLCILNCCMAIGRLELAFIEAPLVDLRKVGASATPNEEEVHALFLAWGMNYTPSTPSKATTNVAVWSRKQQTFGKFAQI